MTTPELVGQWSLIGSVSITGEIALIADEPEPNGVTDWLNGTDEQLEGRINPTSGLELKIKPDGHFCEQLSGKPAICWYDVEGVLTEEISPFTGVLVVNEQGAYLLPDGLPEWSGTTPGRYGKAVLRLDDGDTKISDSIRVQGFHLVRTINVVTDELYLDRIILAYKRQG